jgi:hypothetical protein
VVCTKKVDFSGFARGTGGGCHKLCGAMATSRTEGCESIIGCPHFTARSIQKNTPAMQSERIIIIPPTHEQSVFSFHVERDLADPFLRYLESKDLTPWRPPTAQPKTGPNGHEVTQIQIDVETVMPEASLRQLVADFLKDR